MEPFPTELWERILLNLKPTDLTILATTCRFLYAVAQSVMYRTVDLTTKWFSSKKHKYRQSLAAQPSLGAFVHTVSIDEQEFSCRTLSLYPNVQELKLINPNFNRIPLLRIFDVLPRLRAIFFSELTLTSHLVSPPSDMKNIETSSLCLLHISHLIATYTTDILLSYLTRHGPIHVLTTLKLDACDELPHTMLQFLISTPSFRHLSLPWAEPSSSHPIYALPASALPVLAHLETLTNLLALFIPGRPVRSVRLNCFVDPPDDALCKLEHSAAPITALELTLPGPWLRHAPRTLRHLEWGDAGKVCLLDSHAIPCAPHNLRLPQDRLLASFPFWASMPDLEHIYGFVWSSPEDTEMIIKSSQDEIIRAASAANPSVRECVFTSRGSYTEGHAWVKMRSGQWECRERGAEC